MTLAEFTTPGLIVPHLTGRDATSAIHELSLALQRAGCVSDWLQFYHAALTREFLLSTDLAAGVAFPHARSTSVRRLAFAFGRVDPPFLWSPKIPQPAHLVFLVAVPASDSAHYLPLLAGLARLAGLAALRETIQHAPDFLQILAAFEQIDLPGTTAAAPLIS